MSEGKLGHYPREVSIRAVREAVAYRVGAELRWNDLEAARAEGEGDVLDHGGRVEEVQVGERAVEAANWANPRRGGR